MRIEHFETLKPICPRCRTDHGTEARLTLGAIATQANGTIVEGTLDCSNPHCGVSYPIIDAIPIIVADLAKYVNDSIHSITARTDLSEHSEAILGTATGPGATFNINRHYLGTYGWDHYGDMASSALREREQRNAPPGSLLACLAAGLNLLSNRIQAPVLDIGCSVGRSSFELAARGDGLILGVDLNFAALRLAQRVLREGRVSYPLKQLGIVYERQDYAVVFPHKDRVDYWACDALALPFAVGTFGFVNAMNVIDNVSSPVDFLVSMSQALRPGGYALLATPYDWAPPVPVKNWLGGRAAFGVDSVDSASALRALLRGEASNPALKELRLTGELEHHPWHVRVHNRRTASYDTHILACRKVESRND